MQVDLDIKLAYLIYIPSTDILDQVILSVWNKEPFWRCLGIWVWLLLLLMQLMYSISSCICARGSNKKDLRFISFMLCLSLTDWLTDWLPFSKVDWCDPGVWRYHLKTCCYCCLCWWRGSCWQQLVDLGADVWLVTKLNFCSDFEHKVWSRF